MFAEDGDSSPGVGVKLPNRNYLQSHLLLQTMQALGATRVVISSGSRSTPLTHCAMEQDALEKYLHFDERGAAFFALGLAKVDEVPALLICTSGTAAANYFPAVIESAQSMVPLVALTADRPVSLRHTGAPQTIDQHRLYGSSVRLFAETPPVTLDLPKLRGVCDTAAVAYAAAMAEPRGPVHVNVPLDEPLAPLDADATAVNDLWHQLKDHVPARFGAVSNAAQTVGDADVERIAGAQAGLIVAGPGAARNAAEREAIYFLSRQLGWPVFADVLSGLRFFGEPVVPYYDAFLRNGSLHQLAPDLVLAFGAFPTSKVLNSYLDRHRSAFTLRIQAHELLQDPTRRTTRTVHAPVAEWCRQVAAEVRVARDSWLLEPFQRAAGALRAALSQCSLLDDGDCELAFLQAALSVAGLYERCCLANSLSVRYADTLFAFDGSPLHTHGMRGANGIDGTLAHAAGIAAASRGRVLLVTGDIAFLHDLNSLALVQKYSKNLDILLFNNNGGGIFHFLPVADLSSHFETTHGTPHNLHLQAAATLFGLEWQQVQSSSALSAQLQRPASVARIFEVTTDRRRNHERHIYWMDLLSKAVI